MTDLPPTSTPAPPSRRRVSRSKDDRVIGGVCGGLGEHLDVDPVLFRLGCVLLAFAGGSGLLAYLVAWLVLPDSSASSAPPRERRGSGPAVGVVVGSVLLAIGVLHLLDLDFPFPLVRIGWPAALVAGGILFVVWGRSQRHDTPPEPPLGTPAAELVVPPPAPAPTSPAVVEEGRSRPSVTALCLGGFLVLAGLLAAGDLLDWFDVSATGVLALAVIVFGGGAIAGAFLGGGRALIPLGVLSALALMFVSWVDIPLEGGIGRFDRAPASTAELRDEYHHAIGEMTIDLRDLDLADGEEASVDLSLGVGHLIVFVPPDVDLDLDAGAGLGEVVAFGRSESGTSPELSVHDDVPGSDARLVVDAHVGIGQVEVLTREPRLVGR
jgi:phage shock protein PspC (stress-responsive transcriptional regulator)